MLLVLTDNMIAECSRTDCNRLGDKLKKSWVSQPYCFFITFVGQVDVVEAYKLKIIGEADKVKISMVEADSRIDPFLLLQYDFNKISVDCL
jgi:hypothetical protein